MLIHTLAIINIHTSKVARGESRQNRIRTQRIGAPSLSLTTAPYRLPGREPRHANVERHLQNIPNSAKSKNAGVKRQKLISRNTWFKMLTLIPKCMLFVSSEMDRFEALLTALHCWLENSPWHISVEQQYRYNMRCQHNILPLNVLQERRGECQGYVRITGSANCSGTAVYKGIFFPPPLFWLSESGKGVSECILKTGIRLFRCRALAFLCKWQMKMKWAYSGALFEHNFLAILSGCQITRPVWPSVQFQLCVLTRGCVIEKVWAPNYLWSQGRMDHSNAICKNHAAASQTTDVLETHDSTAQLRKY